MQSALIEDEPQRFHRDDDDHDGDRGHRRER